MTWFEDKKYSLWVFEDDFAYFYLEAIRKIEGMSIFSRWLSYLRIRNKHVKNFNLSGFDDEYTCESMFLYLIKDLITELNGENNKNNAETKLFRNLKVDHNNSSNYKFEIVSNELFRKLADDKFNEFCTKFNELKIEKPLEDYQFYYSNKDQIISKLLEFYIYVYKSLLVHY
ncbi:hypothetical protein [Mycoplasmopsis caviae]|uniref:Uncharacterized protein n=1 Tax=Mycoplasmopsis caviae TaxID=55603 RepID=A0A3P8KNP4_9BACT|nr:hypothetical protein [Mycoplasmopsis caviae]VDR42558.1 Uncharacterised protein [Mycoplasmopsis caviae]